MISTAKIKEHVNMNKLSLLPLALLLASCGGAPSSQDSKATGLSTEESKATGFSTEESEATGLSSEATPYSLDVKVATPAGAPAVGLFRHLASENLEVNADPASVVAYMSESSDKDVVILPTNAGLTSIVKKAAPYKLAATLTFGNFYLAATGHDDDSQLDADDYVVLFQQNNVPDKLFQYCYGDLNLTNTHYVTAATDAQRVLISGVNEADDNAPADYVLIAEPAFTAAKSKNADISEYSSLQSVFKEKSGGKEITQASIFVANSSDKAKVSVFLSEIEKDLNSFLANPDVLDEATKGLDAAFVQSKLSAPAAMLKNMAKANNRMGLGYKKAYDNKESIAEFMKLFGMNEVNEEVYYQ